MKIVIFTRMADSQQAQASFKLSSLDPTLNIALEIREITEDCCMQILPKPPCSKCARDWFGDIGADDIIIVYVPVYKNVQLRLVSMTGDASHLRIVVEILKRFDKRYLFLQAPGSHQLIDYSIEPYLREFKVARFETPLEASVLLKNLVPHPLSHRVTEIPRETVFKMPAWLYLPLVVLLLIMVYYQNNAHSREIAEMATKLKVEHSMYTEELDKYIRVQQEYETCKTKYKALQDEHRIEIEKLEQKNRIHLEQQVQNNRIDLDQQERKIQVVNPKNREVNDNVSLLDPLDEIFRTVVDRLGKVVWGAANWKFEFSSSDNWIST